MTAPLPRIKVHEDGRVAITGDRRCTTIAVSLDGWFVEVDADTAGWRDAAIVPLVDGIHGVGLAPGQARFPFDVWATHTIAVGQGGQLLGPDAAREFAASLISAADWAERHANASTP